MIASPWRWEGWSAAGFASDRVGVIEVEVDLGDVGRNVGDVAEDTGDVGVHSGVVGCCCKALVRHPVKAGTIHSRSGVCGR